MAKAVAKERISLPGFELERELGRGAHSVVFAATRHGKRCALKVPRARGAWTRWVYREAVALAKVSHPGLPAVLEVGEQDGVPYLAMELVEGETLEVALAKGIIDAKRSLGIAIELASALGAVHDAGLVHRDVKPQNVILTVVGCRLVDFGFAAPIGRALRDASAGTAGYAAPEQLDATGDVDGRADLFALGRVLEECLGPSLVGEPGLSTILRGLLARTAAERYPDALAVSRDLELYAAGSAPLGASSYAASPSRTPLVGRKQEIAGLTDDWNVHGLETGSCAVVRGRAGSGKSRLAVELLERAQAHRPRCVLNVSASEGDAPLALLRRLLEAYATPDRRSAVNSREAPLRLAARGPLGTVAHVIAPSLAAFFGPSSGADTAPGGFVDAAAEFVLRLVRETGPTVIVLDDLQWADPVSRRVAICLAQRVREAPLTLLLATRDAETPTLPHERVVDLGPLSDEQVEELVQQQLGRRVDPAISRRVRMLSDGMPLSVLDALAGLLDGGAVRPVSGEFVLEPARAEAVLGRVGVRRMLAQRVEELPPATRVVLEAASVLGRSFEDARLGKALELESRDLAFGLMEARRAGLIELLPGERHRFVHDSLREWLEQALPEEERRRLHQCAAETYLADDRNDFDSLCAAARHGALGDLSSNARVIAGVAQRATRAALERYDNEAALQYAAITARACEAGHLPIPAAYNAERGEALLRLGRSDEALNAYREALGTVESKMAEAIALGRISWIKQAQFDPEAATPFLRRAFEALGDEMPDGGARTIARSVGATVRNATRGTFHRVIGHQRERIELLCELHYINARVAIELSDPKRLIQSAIEALGLAQRLGDSRAHARARALYAAVLAVIGTAGPAERQMAEAEAMSSALADPVTTTLVLQLRGVMASYRGAFDEALELFARCLDEFGPWCELREYFINAATAVVIEGCRGRSGHAMTWLERIQRRRAMQESPPALDQYMALRFRATLAASGRSFAAGSPMGKQEARGLHVFMWGPRAAYLFETNDLGPEFEALTREFDAERIDPRTAHLMVSEYYVVVAHARIHQCLTAKPNERNARMRALRRTAGDLRRAARVELIAAHATFVEAAVAWFEGDAERCRHGMAKAEATAEREHCVWVIHAAARLRAHMLTQEGLTEAARDRARFAESVAREYGAEPRARLIRQEFELPSPTTLAPSRMSVSRSSSRTRHRLATLLAAIRVRAPQSSPLEQLQEFVDDIVRDAQAQRGYACLAASADGREELSGARDNQGQGWAVDPVLGQRLRHCMDTGIVWNPGAGDSDGAHAIAYPLRIYDKTVGVLYVERTPLAPAFTVDDQELLLVLSHQIPVALEITRLIREREALQESLEQARKMEAVGQLAGGLAHDFNNMLAVIQSSLDYMHSQPPSEWSNEELSTIAEATERAARLTSQLLMFASDEAAPDGHYRLDALARDLENMFRRLLPENVALALQSEADLPLVNIDRSGFERAAVNLVVNARDAVVSGGQIKVNVARVVAGAEQLLRGAPHEGEYVAFSISDDGCGIDAQILPRVFEPFFTTKGAGRGTGLGLSTVYSFVRKSGGYIEIDSKRGLGTRLTLLFPCVGER